MGTESEIVSPPPSCVMKKSVDPDVEPPPPLMDKELVVMSGTMDKDISARTPLARFCRSSWLNLIVGCAAACVAAQACAAISHIDSRLAYRPCPANGYLMPFLPR
ncbi:hypothetical protein D3C87_1429150 [compost metagenome]